MKSRRLSQSILGAWRGICHVFATEQNFRIQITCAVVVLVLSFYVDISRFEYIVVLLLIILILVLELINSAVEVFADVVTPRLSGHIQVVKDVMAGSVLVASFGSLILFLVIFVPHLIDLASVFLLQ